MMENMLLVSDDLMLRPLVENIEGIYHDQEVTLTCHNRYALGLIF
ncbi:hypothetical protein ESA_00619 [Cronobacter sakazakii ATCC BAA-894]|uniref:Uncharacterized protein n=1 Tax=Cronobacter sakazakii (strain ATCC BAA-894) TaxID=290339 RepID=A7MHZ3_CROS8|nr:hypothetical protein ESA_00619 [Cronobacter sakazakii ATCC BAA-894]